MRSLALANMKGGAGKSTVGAQLIPFQLGEGPVVVIDADRLGLLSTWVRERRQDGDLTAFTALTPAALVEAFKSARDRLGPDRGWIVIDTPANAVELTELAIRMADLTLIPTRPATSDLRAAIPTIEIAQRFQRRHGIVLTGAPPRRHGTDAPDLREAREILQPAGGRVWRGQLTHRLAFSRAFGQGRSVVEFAPGGDGAAEVGSLWEAVQTEFQRLAPGDGGSN